MFASFFYQGEPPEPETLVDMARECLVATMRSDRGFDDDVCEQMVDALASAWQAARQHARREAVRDALSNSELPDEDEPCFSSAADAERAYCKRAQRVYAPRVRRAFPHYDPDDETISWPEGLAYRAGWPKAFLLALASTIGEIEAERTVAMFRHMQRMEAS